MRLDNAESLTFGGARRDEANREEPTAAPRPLWRSIGRGFLYRCPNCGKGKLFKGYLTAVDTCAVCDEEFRHHRADDLPPYLTVFVVGHIVVALFMGAEQAVTLSLAAHLAIWIPITLVLTLGLLRPFRGATIGLQWALRMHGFGGAAENADH